MSENKELQKKEVFVDIVPRDENCGNTGLFAGMFGSRIIRPGVMGLLFPEPKSDETKKINESESESVKSDDDLTPEEQYIKDAILACMDSDNE